KRVVEVELTSERSSEGTTPDRPSEKLEREAPGIRLLGEGSLQSVKHFVTEKPPRLMLDLHGIRDVSASLKGAPVPLPIKGLRKIQKPDRIRVIVDFERPLVAFRVRRAGSVVEIDMQPGSALPTPADPRRAEPNATPVADVRPAPSAPEPGDPDSRSAPSETDPVQVTDPVREAIRGMLTRGSAYSMRESVPSATPVAPQEDPVGQRVVRVRN
ncbi:MAG: AMIN domain-containing protein, partial [Proteobacteria bacterium]|nr:AMIN domain-containing protein [Pseudomonadota bacterium]